MQLTPRTCVMRSNPLLITIFYFFFFFPFFFFLFDVKVDILIKVSSIHVVDLIFSFAEPFSQYTIKLAANTSVGKGPFATRNYSTEEGGI